MPDFSHSLESKHSKLYTKYLNLALTEANQEANQLMFKA
jgi:hypothetical protein